MIRRLAVAASLGLVLAAGLAPPAAAHPLGNFTVSRFSGLEISPDTVTVHYAVDMAEIPALQERPALDGDGDGRVGEDELAAYARRAGPRLLRGVSLRADGDAVALQVVSARASLAPGRGGLDVLRIDARFRGRLSHPEADLVYTDANFEGRLGWREVVARAIDGQGIVSSSVPATSVSDGLRAYPRDRLAAPLDVAGARVVVRPGADGGGAAGSSGGGDRVWEPLGDSFSSLVERDASPGFLVGALLVALAAGALHALGPGHGKTVMAAYLVGAEGRARHAVAIGAAVSLMHTASVVALGLATLWASHLWPPERVFPWLSLASALVVLALGAWLVASRWRAARRRGRDRAHAPGEPGHDHAHAPGERGHDHAHVHGEPGHDHGWGHHHHGPPAGVSPLSARGLAAVALSGGLLPSPTALVVLLGAIALHRVALGVFLVGAFSVGLAAALAAVGLLVLRAREVAHRHLGAGVGALLPLASAGAILAVGGFLTARAVVALGA